MKKFQPAIKWSGSKRSQLESIISYISKSQYDIYYEPFCGGASMLRGVIQSNIHFNKYICSDINNDLIRLWNDIMYDVDRLIYDYTIMWNELNVLNIDDKKKYYYDVRSRFNEFKSTSDFLFIMRTTTNGMPRYNNKGEFNNSFHLSRNGIEPKRLKNILLEWSNILNENQVEFIHQSYNKVNTTSSDFIYLDPPYANTKGMYYGGINLDEFFNWIRTQDSEYILSFDGKINNFDYSYNVPNDIYDEHIYLKSGNSSFRRLNSNNDIIVYESLYIKNN